MRMVQFRIPYEFIRTHTRLSWREVLFALERDLIEPGAPVDVAVDRLVDEERSEPTVMDLAGLQRTGHLRAHVERLAASETDFSDDAIREKWLCISLSWLFVNRSQFSDPLALVAMVYADFDYPEEMADFVRYMPSAEPDLGSRELNELRLIRNWERFVESCTVRGRVMSS